jgi:hypothetical protein
LGYTLEAVVTKRALAAALAKRFPAASPVELAQGFVLVPITLPLIAEISAGRPWREGAQLVGGCVIYDAHGKIVERSSSQLPQALADALADISQFGAVAYLEAEFFGGYGIQASVIWEGGEIVLGPLIEEEDDPVRRLAEAAINRALRRLGVEKEEDALDEFDTVDLGRHRHTEEWLAGTDSRPPP